jgi:uncharacterized protein involved in type VI secretion and phage assembly
MIGLDTTEALMTWVRTHFFGKYAGTVVDTADPLNKGRLKVEVPDVYGSGVGVWALPCVPYAGDDIGFKSFPPKGTNVWIEFEKGDISYPVWTGFFWGDGEMPSEAGSGDNVKLWKTGAMTLTIDDQAGEVKITTTGGATLTLTADISAEVNSGSTVTIPTGGATLTLASDINAEVSASTVSITTSEVTISAVGKLAVSSAGVSVNDGSFSVM